MIRIDTKDAHGKSNGWVMPVWSALDNPELRPEQVYITAIAARTRKGPHLHMVRRGMFLGLTGVVLFRVRSRDGVYREIESGRGGVRSLVMVEPGEACALYNALNWSEAKVLNMPSPAWSKEAPDEHEVTGWQDPAWWIQ